MRATGLAMPTLERERLFRVLEQSSLRWLERWDGMGEPNGGLNNSGPHVEWWREVDGTGQGKGGKGSWCAVVQSAADCWAARELGLILPFSTSRGAKRYVKNVAAAGSWVARPRGPMGVAGVEYLGAPRKGDRICWHRGDPKRPGQRWQGHVARVVRYDVASDVLVVREGNRNNRRDAAGRGYAVVGLRHVQDWRKRLYGIARLAG
jgi:hypothetical protein